MANLAGFSDKNPFFNSTLAYYGDGDGEIFASFSVASQPAWVFQSATGERVTESRALGEDDINSRLNAISSGD